MLLSVIIPAHNEERHLEPTVRGVIAALAPEGIPHEIVIVNDNSSDGTQAVAEALAAENPDVHVVQRTRLPGFGRAVRAGLETFRGDAMVLVMADQSDRPADIVSYYRKLEEGYDCVYGSRFRRESQVSDYPPVKLAVNRIVNNMMRVLFWTRFNDLTNAFKAFRREVVETCGPYSSSHFNILIEMSLSALIRRYAIAEIPVAWSGRTWGSSNLRLSQMGRRYLSVLLKMFFEQLLLRDDILEERLIQRSHSADRLRQLEERVAGVESEIATVRGALASAPAAKPARKASARKPASRAKKKTRARRPRTPEADGE